MGDAFERMFAAKRASVLSSGSEERTRILLPEVEAPSRDAVRAAQPPRIYCVECQRDAEVLYWERLQWKDLFIARILCHGQQRMVTVEPEQRFRSRWDSNEGILWSSLADLPNLENEFAEAERRMLQMAERAAAIEAVLKNKPR